MRTDHEEAIIADARFHAALFGADVHGHMFADRIIAPDDQARRLTLVAQMLWRET